MFSRKLGRNFRHRLRVAFACRGRVEGLTVKAALVPRRRVRGPCNAVSTGNLRCSDLIQPRFIALREGRVSP